MVSDYCIKRIAPHTGPSDAAALRRYLCDLVAEGNRPPRIGGNYDWPTISREAGATVDNIERHLLPILDAVSRSARMPRTEPEAPPKPEVAHPRRATLREMVAQHYGRFLPQDKAAIAAQVLNRVWDAA